MHNLRFWVINIIGATLLGLAGVQGWLLTAFQADSSHLSVVIAGILVWGLVMCWRRLRWVKNAPTANKTGKMTDDQLAVEIETQIGPIRTLANHEILLGLIGTVIGLILAFKGLDAASIGDIGLASEMLGQVISGVSVALYTTLAGSLAYLWLFSQFKVLELAAAQMWLKKGQKPMSEREEVISMFGPVEDLNADFISARKYVWGMKFPDRTAWRRRVDQGAPMRTASGLRIPPKPNSHYDEWTDWDDWLGVDR